MIAVIDDHRTEIVALCRDHHVLRLDLFGSAVSRRFNEATSDLDFLVEFEPELTQGYADTYFGLLESLEALLGRSVDLVVDSSVTNPYVRRSIESSRAPLYVR